MAARKSQEMIVFTMIQILTFLAIQSNYN
jgi:hypothetical protein